MNSKRKLRQLSAVLLVACMALIALGPAPAAQAAKGNPNPGVFPPQSHPFGHTYREWNARFFQWWISIPVAVNPVLDETGALCGEAQSGPVWFLLSNAGGSTVRNCTIPPGKAIMVLPAGTECSAVEPDPFHGDTEAEMRACAHQWMDSWLMDAAIEVDGVAVQDLLTSYKFDTPLYTLHYPDGSFLGVPGPGTTQSVGESAFVILAPLPAGPHTIHMSFAFGGPSPSSGEVTYNLTVRR